MLLRLVDPETLADRALASGVLADDERAAVQRQQPEPARRARAASYLLLREILSELAGGDPARWRFARTPLGRPHLPDRPDLRLSLSRTPGLVGVVVSDEHDVGLDVERVVEVPDVLALAADHLAEADVDAVRRAPADHRAAVFTEIWVATEAVLKAEGTGIGAGLIVPDDVRRRWRVETLDAGPDHRAALAREASRPTVG
jgi:4'-phosphopantetheinyl transferase